MSASHLTLLLASVTLQEFLREREIKCRVFTTNLKTIYLANNLKFTVKTLETRHL